MALSLLKYINRDVLSLELPLEATLQLIIEFSSKQSLLSTSAWNSLKLLISLIVLSEVARLLSTKVDFTSFKLVFYIFIPWLPFKKLLFGTPEISCVSGGETLSRSSTIKHLIDYHSHFHVIHRFLPLCQDFC